MKPFTLLALLIVFFFLGTLSWADIPQLINYQGMLTESDGTTPVEDGTYNLGFKIYGSESGTDSLWWEYHSNVQVTHGLFNVILGSVSSLDLLFDTDYWLEIKVGAETMPNRLRLTSVGYAYRARWAAMSDTADYALSSPSGPGDYTWTFRITDTADTTITTGGRWGVARFGNILYGNQDSTHVNLGVVCTTGTSGQNYKYCTVGGGYKNTASSGWATVGGGHSNTAWDLGTTVGGGSINTASGGYATVGGGFDNTAIGAYATVGGGSHNNASGIHATVGGGVDDTASGSRATVGGGYGNTASGDSATVGGGNRNTARGRCATVGGGHGNTASGLDATVGGGHGNTASSGGATVGGGSQNTASGGYATMGGGYYNTVSGYIATVGGGNDNTGSGDFATVGGGARNIANGYSATVGGGYYNTAGGAYSFAAGRKARAYHLGTFVWADSSVNEDFASTGNNQFLIRAAGGVGIGTNSPDERLQVENSASSGHSFLKIEASHASDWGEAGLRIKTPQNTWHLRMDDDANNNIPDGALGLRSQDLGQEVMVWTESGNVGIGTTTPATKLAVLGLTSTDSYNYVKVNTATGAFYYESSSKRYKDDVRPLEDDFHKIFQAEPKSFIDKASGQREIGYIAEEFDGMGLNNLVIYNKEGQPDGLKYELVSLYLLEVVKDLKAENEELTRRIEVLEGR